MRGQADATWTEFEIFCEKMGWDPETTTRADVEAFGGKRGRAEHWDNLQNSHHIYKQCEVCGLKICVNNWEDKKSRTPRLGGLIICGSCDPRHIDDRYMKKGYRIINPYKLQILKMAQVTHKMAERHCLKYNLPTEGCKCPACVSRRIVGA